MVYQIFDNIYINLYLPNLNWVSPYWVYQMSTEWYTQLENKKLFFNF